MSSLARITWEPITLQLRQPFRIAHGVSDTRQAFWLRLASDAGWGEGTIPAYYGIRESEMFAFWDAAARRADPFPDDPAEILNWVGEDGPAPARCAVDLALHDRIGRQRGVPLHQLLGLPKPAATSTAFTLSIAPPDEMARMATQLADYPVIKVKLGSDDDVARIAAIRTARPDARLYVDANAGWSPEEAVRRVRELAAFDLELIEQPVAEHDIAGLGYVQAHTDVPVVADESVQSLGDVERLAAAGVRGVNLKLMKIGGLGPCLAMLRCARELGMRVMLGCMIETSLGVTAMAHLAGLADWLDLDAPLLIANDPFEGLCYDQHARIQVPQRPGIGVSAIEQRDRGPG
jgi:L-alanine-DL-glutamate epimerase-like enolase superfamily enzyme